MARQAEHAAQSLAKGSRVVVFVAADADMAPPSHYVEVIELLGGGLRDGGWMGEAGRRAVTRWRSCPA